MLGRTRAGRPRTARLLVVVVGAAVFSSSSSNASPLSTIVGAPTSAGPRRWAQSTCNSVHGGSIMTREPRVGIYWPRVRVQKLTQYFVQPVSTTVSRSRSTHDPNRPQRRNRFGFPATSSLHFNRTTTHPNFNAAHDDSVRASGQRLPFTHSYGMFVSAGAESVYKQREMQI